MLADHTSLVSRETDPSAMPNQISNDLHSNTWFYHGEVNFNPDTGKQGQEVIFSRKIKVTAHPQLIFNNKHLRVLLDFKLNLHDHFENILNRDNRTIGLLQKL